MQVQFVYLLVYALHFHQMEEVKKAAETEFNQICGVAKEEVSSPFTNWVSCLYSVY